MYQSSRSTDLPAAVDGQRTGLSLLNTDQLPDDQGWAGLGRARAGQAAPKTVVGRHFTAVHSFHFGDGKDCTRTRPILTAQVQALAALPTKIAPTCRCAFRLQPVTLRLCIQNSYSPVKTYD